MGKVTLIVLGLLLILLLSAIPIYASHSPEVDRDIVYRNCQGINLAMDLFYPEKSDSPLPVVVYIHGGGWYSGDKTDSIGQDNIPELTGRGYLVAAINYRLAPRYVFPAQIEDVKYAIRFLRANAATYGLDPTRIGVMGDSAGGHLAALLGLTDDNCGLGMTSGYTEQSARVQAVVDMFGPNNLTTFFESNKSFLFLEHVFSTDDPESEIIKQASPINYVSKDAPPFLLIHGDKDEQVLPEQSEELYEKLVAADVPASLMVVKNCGHELVPTGGPLYPDSSEIAKSIGGFFDQYLK